MSLFIEKLLYLTKLQLRFSLANLTRKEHLLIYQMGKVGSSSIMSSLYNQGLNKTYAIDRVYYLTEAGIDYIEEFTAKQAYGSIENFSNAMKKQIWRSRFLAGKFTKERLLNKKKKLKVLTMVREPIARNISAFFQTYDWYVEETQKEQQSQFAFLKSVEQCFFEKYPHSMPLTWLDDEIQQSLEINVFETDFQKEKGYNIYYGEYADLLLLKLECLDKCVQSAFEEFLGVKNFTLSKANLGQDKKYSAVYKNLLKVIEVPEKYINEVYSSKYAQHFYTEEEIERFREKWSRKIKT
jgi:hypothetical protein